MGGMADDLDTLKNDTLAALGAAQDRAQWDAIRVGTLGKSGALTGLLKQLGKLDPEERKLRGQALNRLRDKLTRAIEERGREIEEPGSGSAPEVRTGGCDNARAVRAPVQSIPSAVPSKK
ncbi:PheS [Gluconobacter oxydans H24]|nr:PheS [Gluconobacter oxydans H24]